MKRFLALFLFCLLYFSVLAQQNSERAFFYFGGMLAKPSRTGNADYLRTLQDTMQVLAPFSVKNTVGMPAGLLVRKNKTEIDLGGYLSFGKLGSSKDANAPYINNTDIEIHFGVNYLPAKFFIIGTQLYTVAETNTIKDYTSQALTDGGIRPELNIFRGYSFGIKLQAGFNMQLDKDGATIIRVMPFYALGISKYDYMRSSDLWLKNYTGTTKTSINMAGIAATVAISF